MPVSPAKNSLLTLQLNLEAETQIKDWSWRMKLKSKSPQSLLHSDSFWVSICLNVTNGFWVVDAWSFRQFQFQKGEENLGVRKMNAIGSQDTLDGAVEWEERQRWVFFLMFFSVKVSFLICCIKREFCPGRISMPGSVELFCSCGFCWRSSARSWFTRVVEVFVSCWAFFIDATSVSCDTAATLSWLSASPIFLDDNAK